jgi:presenilin-like A22 family membrane protease
MLIITGIILLMLKLMPNLFSYIIFKIIESIAIFSSIIIILVPYNPPEFLILGAGIGIITARLVFAKNIFLRNITSIIATAGAGALIGASIGADAIAIFIILLAIYDYIAVFKTKHMVALAKGIIDKNLAFTFAIPTKEKKFELGTGDLVIPLTFAVSILAEAKKNYQTEYALLFSGTIIFASMLGLMTTIDTSSKKKTPLPALPVQSTFMIATFIILKIIFL